VERDGVRRSLQQQDGEREESGGSGGTAAAGVGCAGSGAEKRRADGLANLSWGTARPSPCRTGRTRRARARGARRRGERHTFAGASAPAAAPSEARRQGRWKGEECGKGADSRQGQRSPRARRGGNQRLAAAYSPGRAAGSDSSEQRGLRRLATSPPTIPLSRRPQLGRPLAKQPRVRRERKAARVNRGRRRLSRSPRPR
jgi:hypothetical protein